MLKNHPQKELLNVLSATTATWDAGSDTLTIEGLGSFDATTAVKAIKAENSPAVAQVTEVTVTIPDACECPYEYWLKVSGIFNGAFDVTGTFRKEVIYNYINASGATPTPTEVADSLVDQINKDPNAIVTATNAGGVITLTEKYPAPPVGSYGEAIGHYTSGFNAYVSSGSVNTTTDHVEEKVGLNEVRKQFPVKMGDYAGVPNIPVAGATYAKYAFSTTDAEVVDIDQPNVNHKYLKEVVLYVNTDASNYGAFETALDAFITATGL